MSGEDLDYEGGSIVHGRRPWAKREIVGRRRTDAERSGQERNCRQAADGIESVQSWAEINRGY